jgi:hypothetical protein
LKPNPALARAGLLPVLPPEDVREGTVEPGRICQSRTMRIPPDAGIKFWQTLVYGSDLWQVTYSTLRNSIEGYNGFVKDHGYEGLGASDTRRIRGIAAATLFAALALMAAKVRKIQKFLDEATEQPCGTIAHKRKKQPRRRRRNQDIRDALTNVEAITPPLPDQRT